jgi:hypothetical protein
MIPQPNKQEVREFYTLSDLLELKLSDRAYILLYERINGETSVIFHNTYKEEVIAFLREMADEISKSTNFKKIRKNEFQD